MADPNRSALVFFDLEMIKGSHIIEFGAILVCPNTLLELHSYSTLVKPTDLDRIPSLWRNVIPRADILLAPSFSDIADKVFDLLNGRIWAGHNILKYDSPKIKEAFVKIDRPPPLPVATIDTLVLLNKKFKSRVKYMKIFISVSILAQLASLATYFGLGEQTHRSLDDVRMNLDVLKNCGAVVFLESNLPNLFGKDSLDSPTIVTRSQSKLLSPKKSSLPNLFGKDSLNSRTIVTRSQSKLLSLKAGRSSTPNPFDFTELKNILQEHGLQKENIGTNIPKTAMARKKEIKKKETSH